MEGKLLRCRKLATSSFDHVVKLQLLDNALCFARFEAASCSTFGVIMVPNRLLRVAFSLASIALVPRRNSELTIASGNEPCMQVMTCVRESILFFVPTAHHYIYVIHDAKLTPVAPYIHTERHSVQRYLW